MKHSALVSDSTGRSRSAGGTRGDAEQGGGAGRADALRGRDSHEIVGRSAPGMVPAARGRLRRGRVPGAGRAARADDLPHLSGGAARRPRRRGRSPGHVPDPGPEGCVGPAERLGRELAVRRGASGRGAGGPAVRAPRDARASEGRDVGGRRPVVDRSSARVVPRGPGCDRSAARAIPGAGGPLLPRGADPGRGRRPAAAAGEHRPGPADAGPGAAARPVGPARDHSRARWRASPPPDPPRRYRLRSWTRPSRPRPDSRSAGLPGPRARLPPSRKE